MFFPDKKTATQFSLEIPKHFSWPRKFREIFFGFCAQKIFYVFLGKRKGFAQRRLRRRNGWINLSVAQIKTVVIYAF